VFGQVVEPENGDVPGRFARAAVLGQPGAYVRAVTKDLLRFADPALGADRPESGSSKLDFYTEPSDSERNIATEVDRLYDGLSADRPLRNVFATYQEIFTATGLVVVLLAAAAAIGLVFGRGPARLPLLLFAACALALYLGSVATWSYDVRYGVPPLGALAAAGVLGAIALASRRRGVPAAGA
jgi:lipopolysaccharide export LptBFGC system permease protein LptF